LYCVFLVLPWLGFNPTLHFAMDCTGTSTLGTAKPAEASPAVSSAAQKIEAAPGEVHLKAIKWLKEQQFELCRNCTVQGFFGTVCPARSQLSEVAAAVKFGRTFGQDAQAQQQATLDLLSKQPHSNVVLAMRAEFWGQPYWMSAQIFELPFSDLDDWLQQGAVDSPCAGLFARDAVTGLQHLHKLGVEHRDLNPANLMVYTHRGSRVQLRIGNFSNARPRPALWTGRRHRSRSPEVASELPVILFVFFLFFFCLDIYLFIFYFIIGLVFCLLS
jgi:hypothetical protein